MRFLLDENLSPLLAGLLGAAGHEAIHVQQVGLTKSPDQIILHRAELERRVLISADTDFGELLHNSGAVLPSVILLRRETDRSAGAQAELILANLDVLKADLEAGAIAVIEATRIRVRRLPLSL